MAYSAFYARFFGLLDNIKDAFAEVFKSRASFIYLALFVFWQALNWTQAFLVRSNLSSDLVVLHYNVYFGIDLVAGPGAVFFYPSLALTVFLINLLILLFLSRHKNLKTLVHYLLAPAVLFAAFLSLVLLSVYLINFR
jgi:hypothetical protein